MKSFVLALACFGAVAGSLLGAQTDPPTDVNALELQGRFKDAAASLDLALKDASLSAGERKHLEFERDRLEWIKRDFPFTREALFTTLRESVRGLARPEFDLWVKEGRFDSREIDGEQRFMASSVSNLFFRYPDLDPRRQPLRSTAALARQRWETCVAIQTAARAEKKPYVLPKRFHATMVVNVQPDTVPAHEVIRAWLPIPRRYPFQKDFEILSTSSPVRQMADESSPIRSLYLEQPAQKGKPTVFSADYNYTTYGVWFDVNPATVRASDPEAPALRDFLRESPHVVFTPAIRALSNEILAGETNPAVKAKKCFDWIAEHIQYSYAIEYSTIRNISDYCLSHRYGDCGQEALLFITLCRLNGIPARWQSGWNTFPGENTIHDWSEIYLAPYGWMPVDPYMGIFAMRYATGVTADQRRLIRDFHFGGLDQYRMSANSDHNQTLDPPKRTLRSDTVDFQRGELEAGSRNIYFDRYSYSLSLDEIKAP